jgi:hypothetical protein
MKKGLINSLYDQAHVVYEVPYEASALDPSIIAISKQRVWDRYRFAELIVDQMLAITDAHTEVFQTDRDRALIEHIKQSVKTHFGVEE